MYTLRQNKGVISSFVIIDAPLNDNSILTLKTECSTGHSAISQPFGVATQWVSANGAAWIGVGPFTPSINGEYKIQATAGRSPPSIPLSVSEYAKA